jgi:membrane associated rhomboid family serine protease
MSERNNDSKGDVLLRALVFTIGKSLLFLCVIPCAITYLHLRQQVDIHWEETIVVQGKTSNLGEAASGLYGRLPQSSSIGKELVYYKLLLIRNRPSIFFSGVFQPDVLDAADSTTVRTVVGSTDDERDHNRFPYLVVTPIHDHNETMIREEPCIYLSKDNKICGNDAIQIPTNRSSSATSTMRRSHGDSSLHYGRNTHWLQQIVTQIPATSIWIIVNGCIALLYWNQRVSVESVAKIYHRMMPSSSASDAYEIWRTFTGSTAHFDLWHLGLNMMSLLALGKELEGRQLYTSVSFFMYNCSLIPLVAAIWLGLQYLLQQYRPNQFDPHRPTVGYSGVLFAWMVVASLGQRNTCPLIFLPNVCFPTYTILGMVHFNVGPLIQLVVLQVILPRVSFTGHLAGIIAGFLLHWGWLPIRYYQPAVFVPVLYLVYLHQIRKATLLPLDVSVRVVQGSNSQISSLLLYQCFALLYSVTVLGPFSSATLSFAVTLMYWYQLDQAVNRCNDPNSHIHTWAKGYICAGVLVIITDAMTVGSWAVFAVVKFMPTVVMLVRTVSLWYCFVIAQQTLTTVPNDPDGIFEWMLNYTTLHPCRDLVKAFPWIVTQSPTQSVLPSAIPEREGSAFMGTGRRLGGTTAHSTNPWKANRVEEKRNTAR